MSAMHMRNYSRQVCGVAHQQHALLTLQLAVDTPGGLASLKPTPINSRHAPCAQVAIDSASTAAGAVNQHSQGPSM